MASVAETQTFETIPHGLELVGDINTSPEFGTDDLIDGRFAIVPASNDSLELANTGLSVVYLTNDTENQDSQTVVKLHTNNSTGSVIRSERERVLASEFVHPKLIPVVATGLHIHNDGTNNPYIATVYAPEGDLLHKEVTSEVSMQAVLASMIDATEALQELHERGLVHRDVKPANILKGEKVGYLSDLGTVARHRDLEETEPVQDRSLIAGKIGGLAATETGQVIGSISYMPPNRLKGKPATPEDDVFALGASAYEELHGELPWGESGESHEETYWKMVKTQVTVADFPDYVPERVKEVVINCLDRNPKNRASTQDFLGLRQLVT